MQYVIYTQRPTWWQRNGWKVIVAALIYALAFWLMVERCINRDIQDQLASPTAAVALQESQQDSRPGGGDPEGQRRE